MTFPEVFETGDVIKSVLIDPWLLSRDDQPWTVVEGDLFVVGHVSRDPGSIFDHIKLFSMAARIAKVYEHSNLWNGPRYFFSKVE